MPVYKSSLSTQKLSTPPRQLEEGERKPSLKELPSYKKEVGVALNRRQELLNLKERLSSSKLILSADPSSKPWLLARQISNSKLKPETRRLSRESSDASTEYTDSN